MSRWILGGWWMALTLVAATGCSGSASNDSPSCGSGTAALGGASGGNCSAEEGDNESVCGAASGDNSCVSCAKQKCCAEREACQSDAACPATAQCLASCGSNKACASACAQKAGQATYQHAFDIDSCLVESCAASCGL